MDNEGTYWTAQDACCIHAHRSKPLNLRRSMAILRLLKPSVNQVRKASWACRREEQKGSNRTSALSAATLSSESVLVNLAALDAGGGNSIPSCDSPGVAAVEAMAVAAAAAAAVVAAVVTVAEAAVDAGPWKSPRWWRGSRS
eukprot:5965739-Pleurochrysis_carterae.AAC.3